MSQYKVRAIIASSSLILGIAAFTTPIVVLPILHTELDPSFLIYHEIARPLKIYTLYAQDLDVNIDAVLKGLPEEVILPDMTHIGLSFGGAALSVLGLQYFISSLIFFSGYRVNDKVNIISGISLFLSTAAGAGICAGVIANFAETALPAIDGNFGIYEVIFSDHMSALIWGSVGAFFLINCATIAAKGAANGF